MPLPINALEREPRDFIRKVKPGVLDYFCQDLSGLYLPEEFRKRHDSNYDVNNWSLEHLCYGKFGRFTFTTANNKATQQGEATQQPDLLLMGPIIGLKSVANNTQMHRLRHSDLATKAADINNSRITAETAPTLEAVDYGTTYIHCDKKGNPAALIIGGFSRRHDFPYPETRKTTELLFRESLDSSVEVVNLPMY